MRKIYFHHLYDTDKACLKVSIDAISNDKSYHEDFYVKSTGEIFVVETSSLGINHPTISSTLYTEHEFIDSGWNMNFKDFVEKFGSANDYISLFGVPAE